MTDYKLDVGVVNTATSVTGPLAGSPGDGAARVVVSSESLLRGQGQLTIRHRNETYILRQTRHGKLILTK